jgi:hypothetical protein
VYSQSKDCNKSGEALSTSDLKSLSCFIISTTPVEYSKKEKKIVCTPTRKREQQGEL